MINKTKRGTYMRYFKNQKGEVSIFVVIFSTLLITIVTVAFVRIMIQGQQQATATDLSQSAYDSSLAGVEDAKRAIIQYQNICNDGGDCVAAKATLTSNVCNNAIKLIDSSVKPVPEEVKVQVGTDDNKFNQAYTCVTVTMDTPDSPGSLKINESQLIPLISGTDAFDTVQVQWFMKSDMGLDSDSLLKLQPGGSTASLFTDWGSNQPSILRAQMIQVNSSGFKLSDFDDINTSGHSDANTLFLYPTDSSTSAIPYDIRLSDRRQQPTGAPVKTSCVKDFSFGGYSCKARLTMPDPIGGAADKRTAFLRLTSLYNKAHYTITLLDTHTMPGTDKTVTFKGVKPIVDSTGRADSLFRRVKARVELNAGFNYPDAEITTTSNFCKDFMITNDINDFPNINSVDSDGSTNGCKP